MRLSSMVNYSNLLRAYRVGKSKWLDMSISFKDALYIINISKDERVRRFFEDTLEEAKNELLHNEHKDDTMG